MKAILLSLLVVWSAASLAEIASGNPDQDARWLKSVQHMITHGDPLVSTTELHKVELLQIWARENGWVVEVSHTDAVAGTKPEMYFMTVTKRQPHV
jgi:hypothetical protein